jgi:hypothetical protein
MEPVEPKMAIRLTGVDGLMYQRDKLVIIIELYKNEG